MAERPEGGAPEGISAAPAPREKEGTTRERRPRGRRRDRRGPRPASEETPVEVVRRPGAGAESAPAPATPASEVPATPSPEAGKTEPPSPTPETSDKGTPDTHPPSTDTTPASSSTPDLRYIFIPGGDGIDDKAKRWLGKGGRGLGFLGFGILGTLAHAFRVFARTAHQVYDGVLYSAEKFMYEHSGAKNTIPWKWFIKEPEEPEYVRAKKRLAEMQKRTGSGGGSKK